MKTEDNFLPPETFQALRLEAETLPYYDVRFLGTSFKGMHVRSNDELKRGLEAFLEQEIDQQITYLRRSLPGESSNEKVHQDSEVSQYVALLYLNEGNGGTAFFKHRETGAEEYPSTHEVKRVGKSPVRERAKFGKDWCREEAWELTQLVEMQPNRLVVYPSAAFHSRWPRESLGMRRVWLSFFNVT